LLNSLGGVALWAGLAWWLTPLWGAFGMAAAVAAGTLVSSYAATLELKIGDGLSPFDRKLFQGLAVALAGFAAMALADRAVLGPLGFALLLVIWAATSWLALRYGLTRDDRIALSGLSRKLRLV
jgi:O-antigen/teichoic acid export membrane protein